jgi:hypothetical protein
MRRRIRHPKTYKKLAWGNKTPLKKKVLGINVISNGQVFSFSEITYIASIIGRMI